nr:SDR family oxidoreductase [Neobacillus sp. 179.-C4.2 HS]MDP5192665.1 SDR family oxidoreductase [Neobacillus sp. 179.-C4.2 HS]
MFWGIQDEIQIGGEHLSLVLEHLRYAYVVLYLASDEAAFVTGAELVIDGGTTAA